MQLIKFLLILNLLNAVLRLINITQTGIGFQEIIWFLLGSTSLIFLYLFLFKKTTLTKIPISEIKELNKKSIFGRRTFSIKLVNGKIRELKEMKTQADFNELKKMLADNKII